MNFDQLFEHYCRAYSITISGQHLDNGHFPFQQGPNLVQYVPGAVAIGAFDGAHKREMRTKEEIAAELMKIYGAR